MVAIVTMLTMSATKWQNWKLPYNAKTSLGADILGAEVSDASSGSPWGHCTEKICYSQVHHMKIHLLVLDDWKSQCKIACPAIYFSRNICLFQ